MTADKSGQRIAQFRDYLLLTQQAFADKLCISRGYLGDVERGRKEPSYNFIKKLLATTKASADWVITGSGLMCRESPAYVTATQLNTSLLQQIISGVEESLKMQGKTLESEKKAEVISLLYEWESKPHDKREDMPIEKVLKLVS